MGSLSLQLKLNGNQVCHSAFFSEGVVHTATCLMAKAAVCQFWLQGQCGRGESCRFSHTPLTTPQPSVVRGMFSSECNRVANIPGLAKSWSQQLPARTTKAVAMGDPIMGGSLCVASDDGRAMVFKTVVLPDGRQQLQSVNETQLGSPINALLYDLP